MKVDRVLAWMDKSIAFAHMVIALVLMTTTYVIFVASLWLASDRWAWFSGHEKNLCLALISGSVVAIGGQCWMLRRVTIPRFLLEASK